MNRSANGMSLIEVMIAISVLAIAILGLLTAMPVATQATRDAEQHEVARHAIEMYITDVRAAGAWDSWEGSADADGANGWRFDVPELERVEEDVECGLVRGTTDVDNTRQVTVSVNWRGIDKAEREVVITTLVGK